MSVKPNYGIGLLRSVCLTLLAAFAWPQCLAAADTNGAPEGADLQRSNAQIQEAIDKYRDEERVGASNSLVLAERLGVMENLLTNEYAAQARRNENSNTIILVAAGAVAALGILAMAAAAFMQWTSVTRVTTALAALSNARPPPALSAGESHALEISNGRFLGLVERLERRIHELESSVKSPITISNGHSEHSESNHTDAGSPVGESPLPATSEKAAVINLLFDKSQTLLKLERPEAALGCLDELLTLDPGNAHALVKKGAALELLQRFGEAIQCYDLAVASDKSMTSAYLRKGGIFNRMERYAEALACYEQALKKPEQPTGRTDTSTS